MEWIAFLEWPAMALSLVGAYLLGSQSPRRRIVGFAVFCVSNALWVAWGWRDGAWALIVLQFGLLLLNVRGIRRNERELEEQEPELRDRNVVGKVVATS